MELSSALTRVRTRSRKDYEVRIRYSPQNLFRRNIFYSVLRSVSSNQIHYKPDI